MNSILSPVTIEQRVSDALGVHDPALVRAVVSVMHDEVFMTTLDDCDPVIFKLGAEQANAIVYGRIIRPYVAVEYVLDRPCLLRPDGCFALSTNRPARYATEAAALHAAEKARNRSPCGVVSALQQPYLPIA